MADTVRAIADSTSTSDGDDDSDIVITRSKRRRLNGSPLGFVRTSLPVVSGKAQPVFSKQLTALSGIRLPTLIRPRSAYHGWQRPSRIYAEAEALDWLLSSRSSHVEHHLKLTEFCFYRPGFNPRNPAEVFRDPKRGVFAPLNELLSDSEDRSFQWSTEILLFDGFLQYENRRAWVEGVAFGTLAVEYDPDLPTVGRSIFIQSEAAANNGVWYHLAEAEASFRPFQDHYLWVADLAKHCIAFMQQRSDVDLHDFKSDFFEWICLAFLGSSAVSEWYRQYDNHDFRRAVAANIKYIAKEALDDAVDVDDGLAWHSLWKTFFLIFGGEGPITFQQSSLEVRTLVTPYVKNCFRDTYIDRMLCSKTPLHQDHKRHEKLWKQRLSWTSHVQEARPVDFALIKTGDVVGLPQDAEGHWQDTDDLWYGYIIAIEDVRARRTSGNQRRRLHVLWLYRPCDTICGQMRYPYRNELFLSDHCECLQESRDAWIWADQVVSLPQVTLFSDPIPEADGYFVRSVYLTEWNETQGTTEKARGSWSDISDCKEDESDAVDQSSPHTANSFVTLCPSHLSCWHQTEQHGSENFMSGSAVLCRVEGSLLLEPVIVEDSAVDDWMTVRRLLRQETFDPNAPRNHLVYTNTMARVRLDDCIRLCQIRTATSELLDTLPELYRLGGTADCFVLAFKLMGGISVPLDSQDTFSFEAGFDPLAINQEIEPLSTLSLFCGGGHFDRGLSNAGCISIASAVDLDGSAIMTNLVNSEQPADTYFWGSVVKYMELVMNGQYSRAVAAIGTIALIIAGSPCQGFTMMQKDRASDDSVRNASMVALVVAFIDLYRPEYAILENVLGLALPHGKDKQESILSQVVAALVGLGYQTQVFFVSAVNHGAAANRDRIFLSIAAPGLVPLRPVPASHLSARNRATRPSGRMPNGLPYGAKPVTEAPFSFVTTQQATADLPHLGPEGLRPCTKYPDHRLSNTFSDGWRKVMKAIPHFPRGRSAGDSQKQGLIPSVWLEHTLLRGRSKDLNGRFIRYKPDLPFDTITGRCDPRNSRGQAKTVHPDEDRPMTVEEAYRGQSIPQHEVIMGNPGQQWKNAGNCVERRSATAIGVRLAEAWLASNERFAGTGLIGSVARQRPESVVHGPLLRGTASKDVADELQGFPGSLPTSALRSPTNGAISVSRFDDDDSSIASEVVKIRRVDALSTRKSELLSRSEAALDAYTINLVADRSTIDGGKTRESVFSQWRLAGASMPRRIAFDSQSGSPSEPSSNGLLNGETKEGTSTDGVVHHQTENDVAEPMSPVGVIQSDSDGEDQFVDAQEKLINVEEIRKTFSQLR